MKKSIWDLKALLRRHNSRSGAFSASAVVLAIAVVLVLNLLAAQLPRHLTEFDMSESGIYNISDQSKTYLSDLSEDVVLHVLADPEALDSRIVRFLDLYQELSGHLTVEYQDPMVFPSVLSQYETDANTIVVTCEGTDRQEIIPIQEIIGVDLMQYYYNRQYVETDFDAEGLLTSAIDSVLSDHVQHIYQTAGHEETPLSSQITQQLGKLHLSLSSVNLLVDGGIPEDCELLILNEPLRDFSADEVELLHAYFQAGGQILCNLPGQLDPQPNLHRFLEHYGLTVVEGLVADPEHSYQQNPYLFFPEVDHTSVLGAPIAEDATLLFFASRGLQVKDPARESISVQTVLQTSPEALAVVDESTALQGPFVIGAVAEETVDDDTTARLIVFGAGSLVDETLNTTFSNLSNSDLFLTAATAGMEELRSLLIEPVPLATPVNVIPAGGIWALFFILIIPGALLIFGFVRWMHRRKL